MPPATKPAETPPDDRPANNWSSVLGGAALVGAAAGYALMASRFRHFGSGAAGSGGAEMRMAEKVSADFHTLRRKSAEWTREATEKAAREAEERAREASRNFGRNFSRGGASGGSGSSSAAPHAQDGEMRSALATLGLSNDGGVDRATAKKAYFEAALKCHPDTEGGDAAKFTKLTSAYEAVCARIPEP